MMGSASNQTVEDILGTDDIFCARCMQKPLVKSCDCRLQSGREEFVCDKCSKVFPRSEVLMVHKWVHTWEEKNANEKHEPSVAVQTEANSKTTSLHNSSQPRHWYFCPSCSLKFGSKFELLTHTYTHSNKKHECEVCGLLLSSKSHLKRHALVHQKKKAFCTDCGQIFTSPNHLSNHRKSMHSYSYHPFKCELCAKTLKSKVSLNTHKTVHSEQKHNICLACQRSFRTRGMLHAHSLKNGECIISQEGPVSAGEK